MISSSLLTMSAERDLIPITSQKRYYSEPMPPAMTKK